MPSASALRAQIEAELAHRIPAALTPQPRTTRAVVSTGIPAIDDLLHGGFPVGALTEISGPECSGRTTLALSFLAQITKIDRVCAWIDASDTLSPESAAASGVDLTRLLWVRCGVPRCAEPQRPPRPEFKSFPPPKACPTPHSIQRASAKPWERIEQALQATDLLLHGGGFSAIILDLAGITPGQVARIPLATWFRYGAAAARTQASLLLLTQHTFAKSSAELVLECRTQGATERQSTVLTGLERHIEVARQRFADTHQKVVPLRKPPQRVGRTLWQSRTAWAGVQ